MKTTSIAAIKLWIFLLYKGQRAYVCVFAIGDRTVCPNELKFGSEVGFNPEKVIVNIRARYPTPMGPQGRGGGLKQDSGARTHQKVFISH